MVGVQMKTTDNDDRLRLDYRLMAQVACSGRAAISPNGADALDRATRVRRSPCGAALAKNLYTDAHDKERTQRLLDKVRKVASEDRASMARDEKDAGSAATGDAYVQWRGLLGFGEPDKAVTAISTRIAKGKPAPDEAICCWAWPIAAKNKAEAVKAFGRATSDPKYARLARLWVLEARS